jgi:hypothetical protein
MGKAVKVEKGAFDAALRKLIASKPNPAIKATSKPTGADKKR